MLTKALPTTPVLFMYTSYSNRWHVQLNIHVLHTRNLFRNIALIHICMCTLHALNMSHLYLETSSNRLTKMERESTELNPGYCKLTFEQISNKCTSLSSTWWIYTYVTNGRCVWPSLDSPFLYILKKTLNDWLVSLSGYQTIFELLRRRDDFGPSRKRKCLNPTDRCLEARTLLAAVCYLLHLCTKQVRGTGNSCDTHDAL